MTPTEQDNELREQVEKQFDDFIKELRVNTPDGWEIKKYIDLDEALQLITADRKRVALEAMAATLDALDNHKKTLNYIVKDGAPRNHTNYEVYMRKAIEVDTKIAELKAQQEEV